MESTVISPGMTGHAASASPNLGGLIGLFQAELGNTAQAAFSLGAFVSVPTTVSIDYPETIQVEQPIIIDDVEEAPITTAEILMMMEAGDDFYTADISVLLDDNHAFTADPSTTGATALADAADFDWMPSAGAGATAAEDYDYNLVAEGALDSMPELDPLDQYDDAALSFESADSFIFFEQEA
ncbi:hypothetical protein [Thioclava sp. GXIMD2076]|uniref:hypothetical protein n=1 Tax=Thioclava sp. GXIMD2076 TaxID=3131931 RepID=UPI0030CD1A5B